MEGHYEINGECWKLPVGAVWNPKKKSFVCDNDLTMTFSKKSHLYKCRIAPKHKMWDS